MTDPNRPFPIQSEIRRYDDGDIHRPVEYLPASTVPWWLAEVAYEWYVHLFGRRQSLEQLAERGGFGHYELLHLLRREDL